MNYVIIPRIIVVAVVIILTAGACVRGVDWDTTSDTCLVLDKFIKKFTVFKIYTFFDNVNTFIY